MNDLIRTAQVLLAGIGVQKPDRSHTCCPGSGNAMRGILNHQAVGRRDGELFSCSQEYIRCGFAVCDFFSTYDNVEIVHET